MSADGSGLGGDRTGATAEPGGGVEPLPGRGTTPDPAAVRAGGFASAITSTARPAAFSSWMRNVEPSTSGMTPTPSDSNSRRRPGVTMPPSHGPQLIDTTRLPGRRRASTWAVLFSTSLAHA